MVFNPQSIQSLTNPAAFLSQEYAGKLPPCMINLGLQALRLLSSLLLLQASEDAEEALAEINASYARIMQGLYSLFGIFTEDGFGGLLSLKSDTLSMFLGQVQAFANFVAQAAQFYGEVADFVESVENCIKEYEAMKNAGLNATNNAIEGEGLFAGYFEAQVQALAELDRQRNDVENFRDRVNTILSERAADPSIEAAILAQGEEPEEQPEIFRLVFGPPKAKKGQFLYSSDGLYYDSQTRTYDRGEEVPGQADIGFIPDADKWRLDHSPNLGGKGTRISIKDLDNYFDTILDITNIDESDTLKVYYEADHALKVLEGQKLKSVGEIDRQKTKLMDVSGYAADSAIIENFNQQIISETSHFDIKIRKRKKQIELAVKAPDLFNSTTFFQPGEVPINDFSYLVDFNLALDVKKQRMLVLDHGEVSGVVLPVKPIFVRADDSQKQTLIEGLNLQSIGTGDIPITPGLDTTDKPVISLTDPVELSGLIGIYNFLDAEILSPASTEYQVISCNNENIYDAQLVGQSSSKVFDKGLGLPRLDGIVKRQLPNISTTDPSNVGSYLRLPPAEKYQSLFYNKKGCTFDTWVHIPNFGASSISNEVNAGNPVVFNASAGDGAWSDYTYYKLLLANENIGGPNDEDQAFSMTNNFNSDVVRGMVMGFTRDPQWTQPGTTKNRGKDVDIAIDYSFNTYETITSSVFFVAPTQSIQEYGRYDVDFIRSGECVNDDNAYLGFAIATTKETASGYKLDDCSGSFVHLSVSFDVQKDLISVYLNSELLDSKKYSETFGIRPQTPARVPTFVKTGSLEYSNETIPSGTTKVFNNGPMTDAFFTPWIIGGGWTDGLNVSAGQTERSATEYLGGFMNVSHGFQSGLNGYIGSLKLYETPLTTNGVKKNYDAHKNFFEKIEL